MVGEEQERRRSSPGDGVVVVDGVWFAPEYAREAAEIAAWLRGVKGEVLKANRRRRVVRATAPAGEFVIKWYAPGGGLDRWKERVSPSRAAREWETSRALQEHGIAAALPVAFGRKLNVDGELFDLFVSRCVPSPEPLGGFLERASHAMSLPKDLADHLASTADATSVTKWRRLWLGRAVDCLLELHRAGFDHRDFHGGNLLVQGADRGGERLVVIDLHRVSIGTRVTGRRRVRALADLLHTLRFGIAPADVDFAVAHYAAGIGEGTSTARWIRSVRRMIDRREATRVASRSRRAVRESSAFATIAAGGMRGYRRRDVEEAAIYSAIAAATAAIASGSVDVRSIARRSSVAVALAGERRVVVKVYPGDGWRRARPLSRGRAGDAYVNGHALAVRGIDVPSVVAWIRTPDRAYLVIDEIIGSLPLSTWSFQARRDAGSERRVADGVATLLLRLFELGVDVHDLSPKNLLVVDHGESARVSLCDFDGIRFRRRLQVASMIRGLSQVNDLSPSISWTTRRRVLVRLRHRIAQLRGAKIVESIASKTSRRVRKVLASPAVGATQAWGD